MSDARDDRPEISQPVGWRRTQLGWEDASNWTWDLAPDSLPTPATAVHPLVIASLQLMVSVGALLAGASAMGSRRDATARKIG